jgi:hypothetical protein
MVVCPRCQQDYGDSPDGDFREVTRLKDEHDLRCPGGPPAPTRTPAQAQAPNTSHYALGRGAQDGGNAMAQGQIHVQPGDLILLPERDVANRGETYLNFRNRLRMAAQDGHEPALRQLATDFGPVFEAEMASRRQNALPGAPATSSQFAQGQGQGASTSTAAGTGGSTAARSNTSSYLPPPGPRPVPGGYSPYTGTVQAGPTARSTTSSFMPRRSLAGQTQGGQPYTGTRQAGVNAGPTSSSFFGSIANPQPTGARRDTRRRTVRFNSPPVTGGQSGIFPPQAINSGSPIRANRTPSTSLQGTQLGRGTFNMQGRQAQPYQGTKDPQPPPATGNRAGSSWSASINLDPSDEDDTPGPSQRRTTTTSTASNELSQ